MSMKKIVAVPFTRPGIPCVMRPRSFLYDFLQRNPVLGVSDEMSIFHELTGIFVEYGI